MNVIIIQNLTFLWVTYLLLICLYLYPVDHCNFQTVIITTFYIPDHWEEEKKNLVFLLPTNNLKMILGAICIISTGHPPSQGINFSSFYNCRKLSSRNIGQEFSRLKLLSQHGTLERTWTYSDMLARSQLPILKCL